MYGVNEKCFPGSLISMKLIKGIMPHSNYEFSFHKCDTIKADTIQK
jgi:hypothetical protein